MLSFSANVIWSWIKESRNQHIIFGNGIRSLNLRSRQKDLYGEMQAHFLK